MSDDCFLVLPNRMAFPLCSAYGRGSALHDGFFRTYRSRPWLGARGSDGER